MFKLRPSAAAAWTKCHGSVRLVAGTLPFDDTDNTVREEGTAGHWVAHTRATGGTVVPGAIAPNGVEISEEVSEAVDDYLSAIAAWPTVATRYFEQPLHCRGIHEECGGTPDVFAWCWETRTAFVGDLKLGYRHVSEWPNLQMLCYLDGLMHYFGLQVSDVQHVQFLIAQPRAYGFAPMRTARVTMAEVLPWWDLLREGARVAMLPDAPYVTNDGCINCDARHRCPALAQSAAHVLDVSHAATPHDLAFGAAERELQALHWAQSVINARVDGLEQQITHGMKRGEPSRFFELRPSAARLQWKPDMAERVKAVAELMGETVTKPEQLITPTQAVKKLGAAVVNHYSTRPQGGVKLVPADAAMWRRIFGIKP